jgi:hypothetical protein
MNQKYITAQLSVLLLFLACVCFGQNTGTISGTVTSSSGGPIANATVSLENLTTSVKQSVTTDSSGNYRFENLPSGRYRMDVSTAQFAGTPSEDITLDVSRPKTVNITVQATPGPSTVSGTLQVEEETPSLDTVTPQITNPFNTRNIQYLPAPDYLSQTGAAFGASNLSLHTAGVATNGGVGIARGPVVGGQQPVSNNFYIGGMDNNNRAIPGPLTYVSPDATTEFVAFQNQHPPEFGHTLGGQFNTILRTGTNQFHGALFDYLQNRHMNAVDQTFARQGIKDLPRYDQNRLGGNLGFPIIPSKVFFFGDFEFIPLGFDAVPSGPVFAPTAAGFATLTNLPGVSQTNLGVLRQFVGTAPAGTQFTSINGTQIPIGPVSILARQYQNQYNGVGSLDWNIRNSDQVRARYVHNEIHANNSGATLPAFFQPLSDRAMMASLAEYHNFSPKVVTEVRVGYTRFDQSLHNNGVAFPGLNFFPNIQIHEDLNAPVGPGNSVPSAMNTYNIALNTNWNFGRHTIKFGADSRRYIGPLTVSNLGFGSFAFSSLSGFLLNQTPDVFGVRTFGSQNFSGNNWDTFGYLNDSWQVSSNFNINLGVKYTYTSVPKSFELQRLNAIANVPGVLTFNEPETQKTNFAPLVGIAFAPGFVKNTVFRAGFSMNYDTTYPMNGLPSFPPGLVTTQFVPTFGVFPGFFGPGGFGFGFPTPVNVFTPSVTPAQARAATTSFIADQRMPYSMQWDSSLQTQLMHRLIFEARYLGVKTINLPVQSILNANPRVTATQNLPLFFTQPSQATLNSLTTSLNSLAAVQNNPLASAGFTSPIFSLQPRGWSWYNGLQLQATQRFSGGLQAQLAYTWSHLIDNMSGPTFGGAGVFSNASFLVPRGNSIYDHRHRGLATLMWDVGGVGKNRPNWVRDVLANWVVSGTYTYESPASAFIQSGFDSSLSGAFGLGGVVVNPNGVRGAGSGVTALRNSSGQVVGFLANNPNAQFIAGAPGLFTSSARNMLPLNPINNFDTALFKRFALRDRFSFEIHGEAYNVLNHPQFTAADIFSIGSGSGLMRNFLNPASAAFGDPGLAFASHARTLQVGMRLLW